MGRASVRTLTANGETLFRENYEYLSTSIAANKDIETSFVSAVAYNTHDWDTTRLQYTYDAAGNIETVSRDSVLLSKYYYDGLNRLVREDNHTKGKTWVWCYNVGGNITEKRIYNLTTDVNLGSSYTSIPYVYKTSGWKDQLVSYNGQQCVYDALGNPTTYRGHALTWSHVRQLDKYDNHTFSYCADGIRYRKNNTTYTLSGSKILRETNGTRTLTYYYGGSGVIGFRYDGTDYYYLKNLQGDVLSIYDDCGNIVASYCYDAWGKVLNVWNFTDANIGDLNPFRYRSYYYDTETGLYYLNSRYYDPETGRFISSNSAENLGICGIFGCNLYAYCGNNSVVYKNVVDSNRPCVAMLRGPGVNMNGGAVSKPGTNGGTVSVPNTNNVQSNFPICPAISPNTFGHELRASAGWNNSDCFYKSPLLSVGFSSYDTRVAGKEGTFYCFAGKTMDCMNLLGAEYYAGLGFNLNNVIGAEVQIEAVGIGAQISIFGLDISANVNVTGAVSITVSADTKSENGNVHTEGVTLRVNFGGLLGMIVGAYVFLTTGNTSVFARAFNR